MVCLAFLGNARRKGAFFATFFLFVFVFLTVVAFLRAAALVTLPDSSGGWLIKARLGRRATRRSPASQTPH